MAKIGKPLDLLRQLTAKGAVRRGLPVGHLYKAANVRATGRGEDREEETTDDGMVPVTEMFEHGEEGDRRRRRRKRDDDSDEQIDLPRARRSQGGVNLAELFLKAIETIKAAKKIPTVGAVISIIRKAHPKLAENSISWFIYNSYTKANRAELGIVDARLVRRELMWTDASPPPARRGRRSSRFS